MRISKYSIIKFKVMFNMPNTDYIHHIIIKDTLTQGLSYMLTQAEIFIETTKITTGITDNSTHDILNLTLDNTFIQLADNKSVELIIPCLVTDIDLLMDVIATAENANLIPYDTTIITSYAYDNSLLTETTISLPLDFQKCILQEYVHSYTITKSPDSTFYLSFMIPGIGSCGSNNLQYFFSIYPNYNYFLQSNPLDISIYIGDMYKNKLPSHLITNESAHTIAIRFSIKHLDTMKNQPIYVSIKLLVNPNIYKFNEVLALSYANCDLRYLHLNGYPEVICTTNTFPIPTYLTPGIPHIILPTP